jgi:transcriptional regulator with XRE-family HTH domain
MRAFALAAGVTPKLVELYETGKLASPRYSTAVKFAGALKCSVDELMTGTDAAGPELPATGDAA